MSWELDRRPVSSADEDLRTALQAAKLPIDDLDEDGRSFFRFTDRNATVGYGGLEHYGSCALLRSLVVLPQQRRHGYGEAITRQLLTQAARGGANTVYLLTDSATSFFERFGFAKVDRATAPAAILQTRQAASLCPASAALLAKIVQG
ncbi:MULTISPECIES: arsenic resistance N-acetyltransferase ArsN2 [unclassified Rhizobium]|uniref:arsenic resistance N-acetyltransferase ArsN2 n=1 Tax=unclassified Rhizobium TaxID=2613769 RepID=UPI0007EB023D|nr:MULTISPECIES: arsenic resistance N-acetyltransferase ArsN2 [unclassified Rhizobium]ANM14308.1 GCN5-related N-acetyltransferase protein [Rhizobium sp. N324]ANM20692.1 GCN5-related N-acetyltransferase protein [Rhizobium sp. N541]ANM27076.1 GCN5-related N-acetyltransferase protein [Rhizobium sp. N941]OYD00481.1 GCN5-related N-acetyltransferase protein [Rhizobium sp. N4311]